MGSSDPGQWSIARCFESDNGKHRIFCTSWKCIRFRRGTLHQVQILHDTLMDIPVLRGYKAGRWTLLVLKASLLPLQPPHHHCFFLFYSGLLKFNGGEKVHIRLAWEWGIVKLTASVRWAGGVIWWKGVLKVCCRPTQDVFQRQRITSLPARVTGVIYDLIQNLLLSVHSDVRSSGHGAFKSQFQHPNHLELHLTNEYVIRFLFYY